MRRNDNHIIQYLLRVLEIMASDWNSLLKYRESIFDVVTVQKRFEKKRKRGMHIFE
jgi:hypothetical protein